MEYRNDSPNVKPTGKRFLTTIELFQKRAKLRVELAELGVKIASARLDDNEAEDISALRKEYADLTLRIAKVGVRLSERIIKVGP